MIKMIDGQMVLVSEESNNVQKENNMNPTITLTDEQTSQVLELLALGKKHPDTGLTSIEAILTRVVQRGIYDVTYRTTRNIKEYKSYKAFKKSNT